MAGIEPAYPVKETGLAIPRATTAQHPHNEPHD